MMRNLLIMLAFLQMSALAACSSPPTKEPNYQGTRDRSDRAYDDLDRQKDSHKDDSEKPQRW